jgi:hypothetical protein
MVLLLALLGNRGAIAQESIEIPCTDAPKDAVIVLPAPLSDWGQVRCTRYGHAVTAKDGWFWTFPGAYAPVFLPAQMVRENPQRVAHGAYFKQARMTKLEGADAISATARVYAGLDHPKNDVEQVFKLILTNNTGETLEVLFVQGPKDPTTGETQWGYWCQQNSQCSSGSPFLLLDYSKSP